MAREGIERRLAAILAADVVGYSRLMGEDEAGTLAALKALRKELFAPTVAGHHGRIVKLMGDGALVEFPSVVDAVECAVAVQQSMAERNSGIPDDKRIDFRIGVNLGDIIIEGNDIYGDGVNVAARLQELSAPGGITLSATAHEHAIAKIEVGFADGGEHELKNIAKPVRIYHWSDDADRRAGIADKESSLPLPDKPSVAVLPFTNMSGDPEQEYFSDGITEDIITELSRFGSLFVIARNSSFHYKGTSPKIQDVGRELGVQYVVEGSVRNAASRVRITAQLVESKSGNHVWAERYDRDLEDVFAVQDEVVRAIVAAVVPGVTSAQFDHARRKPPESLTAYDHYLKGRESLWRATKQETLAGREMLEMAVELDPGYALALAYLAVTYYWEFQFGWSDTPDAALATGLAYARGAVELDPSCALSHLVLSYGHVYSRQHDIGWTHMERALTLNPNDADSFSVKGLFLAFLGKPAEGIEWIEKALRLNPHEPDWYVWNLGSALYTARRYEESVAAYRQMINPLGENFAILAANYAQLGNAEEARAAMENFRKRVKGELANYPGNSPEGWRRYWTNAFPYKDPADLDHLLDGLRKAGLDV